MVQTLATILMTYVQRPSLKQCGIVAKSLVDLHNFLRDDEGDGEVRSAFSYTCVQMDYNASLPCSIRGSGSSTTGVKM